MKKIILSLCVLICAIPVMSQGIMFDDLSFTEGLKKASGENKLLFIDCYTEWCGPCKLLSQRVFTQEEVGSFFNANFVNIKIDMEKGEGPELAKQYAVKAYPTMLILDAEGLVQHKIVGYTEGERLIEQARLGMDNENSLSALRKSYENGGREPDRVYSYIIALLASNEKEGAVDIANEFFTTLDDDRKADVSLWPIYSNTTVSRWGSVWFEFILANKPEFVHRVGREIVEKLIYDVTTDLFTDVLFKPREGVSLELLPQIAERIQHIDFPDKDKVVAEAEFTLALTKQDAGKAIELFSKYGREFSKKGIMNMVPLMLNSKEEPDPERFPATAALVKLVKEMIVEEQGNL